MKTQKLSERTKYDLQCSLPLCHWSGWFSDPPEVIVVALSLLKSRIANSYKTSHALEGLERLRVAAKISKAVLQLGIGILFLPIFRKAGPFFLRILQMTR